MTSHIISLFLVIKSKASLTGKRNGMRPLFLQVKFNEPRRFQNMDEGNIAMQDLSMASSLLTFPIHALKAACALNMHGVVQIRLCCR